MIKLCCLCFKNKNINCFRICIYRYKKKDENKIYHRNRCKKCDIVIRSQYMKNYYKRKKKYIQSKYKAVDKDKPFDNPLIFFVLI